MPFRAFGLRARVAWQHVIEINGCLLQNPAYRPTHFSFSQKKPLPAVRISQTNVFRLIRKLAWSVQDLIAMNSQGRAEGHRKKGSKKKIDQRKGWPIRFHIIP